MKIKYIAYALSLLVFQSFSSFSQKTLIYSEPDAEYKLALELFNKEKFGAAQKSFSNVLENLRDKNSEIAINCKYYYAVSALELFHKDAEFLLVDFLNKHWDSPKARLVYFYLGKHFFRKKNYKNAIDWFEKVDVYDLTNAELSEYYFKTGYSHFQTNDFEKAKKNLFEVKDLDNKYGPPSNYFYSHIAYQQKNYETALQGFLKLTGNSLFGSMVPYYITQLYYLQGNYEKVVAYAPRLLDSASVQRTPEIARIIGESFFKLQKFSEAIPFLERYKAQSSLPLTREETYELAYAYFRSQNYQKAIDNFSSVSAENDYISHCTFYHAACSYLQLSQKDFARNSFLAAAKMDIDKKVQQDALFNYAKLAYELSYNPYNEAINAFQKYINDYPNSEQLNEVYEYLANIYLTTKNYKDALVSIEKIEIKDERLKSAYQKISFFRGVELFNDKGYVVAIKHFNKALKFPMDNDMLAKSHYWKADAFYRLDKFDSSIVSYTTFTQSPGAITQAFYNLANYNIGYCYFMKKQYPEANKWFRKYLTNTENENPVVINDAYLRTADSYYMMKDYDGAVDYYSRSVNQGKIDTDYALYQKGMALGLMGKNQEKINTLNTLVENYQGSNHLPEAKFELGKTYQVTGNDSMAIINLSRVASEHPTSSYTKKALLRKGLIYRNMDKDDDALVVFQYIVSNYPGTEESKEALESIRNIYVDKNDVAEFFKYVKNLNFSDISESNQDTTFYSAAENRYMEGDCDGATKGFKTYIERFPNGVFALQANFYKAECDLKAKRIDDALQSYNYIISKPANKYSEKSLVNASKICMQKKDYNTAKSLFSKLESNAEYPENILDARYGIMKTNFLLNDYQESVLAAQKLLTTEKIQKSMEEEAHLIIAKSYFELKELTSAVGEFQVVSKFSKNENSAEAQYFIAEIYFKQNLFEQAEKEIFTLINQVPSYDFWIAKGFILLSDIYVEKGNLFQAKHTLQSIIDNYDGAELVKTAQEKLNVILLKEQETEKRKAQEEIILKFNQDANVDELFDSNPPADSLVRSGNDSLMQPIENKTIIPDSQNISPTLPDTISIPDSKKNSGIEEIIKPNDMQNSNDSINNPENNIAPIINSEDEGLKLYEENRNVPPVDSLPANPTNSGFDKPLEEIEKQSDDIMKEIPDIIQEGDNTKENEKINDGGLNNE